MTITISLKTLIVLASVTLVSIGVKAADKTGNDFRRQQQFETSLMAKVDRGTDNPKLWSVLERLQHHKVAGVSVAVIENRKLKWVKGYGLLQTGSRELVDEDTVFSVGSVSKMGNAALVLRLVAEGKLDLDADVNTYLTRWKVPQNRYSNQQKVSLRFLLSHTSGFSQHGFADFYPGETLPSALQTLNGEPPAKHGPVHLMFTPGAKMDYSGGGTTIMQVLIEDVTGLTYPQAARKYVFEPLGMTRSTYDNPLPASFGNIAKAHSRDGEPTAFPRGYEAMPEMAASGLWTSATDMAKLVIALMDSANGSGNFLPSDLAKDMMTRESNSWHGLGPRINGEGQSYVFHHGGANNSYRAWMEGHINNGTGIVILTNGTNGHRLYSEIRKSAEDTYQWPVKAKTGLTSPNF